jgi:hypothetical protein
VMLTVLNVVQAVSRSLYPRGFHSNAHVRVSPRSDTCNKEFKCMRRTVVPLGGTCVSYTECPAGVYCRGNICGGTTAQCQQDSDCVIGRECPVSLRCEAVMKFS